MKNNIRKNKLKEICNTVIKLKKLSASIGIPNLWESEITGKNPWNGNGEEFLEKINKEIANAD